MAGGPCGGRVCLAGGGGWRLGGRAADPARVTLQWPSTSSCSTSGHPQRRHLQVAPARGPTGSHKEDIPGRRSTRGCWLRTALNTLSPAAGPTEEAGCRRPAGPEAACPKTCGHGRAVRVSANSGDLDESSRRYDRFSAGGPDLLSPLPHVTGAGRRSLLLRPQDVWCARPMFGRTA